MKTPMFRFDLGDTTIVLFMDNTWDQRYRGTDVSYATGDWQTVDGNLMVRVNKKSPSSYIVNDEAWEFVINEFQQAYDEWKHRLELDVAREIVT